MSGVDIKAGTRWSVELATQLQETSYGIICVTPESVSSPWLMFEAGALSKSVHDGCVCPYLIDITSDDIVGPLSQYQQAEATKESTWKVLLQINSSMDAGSMQESRLRRYFDNYWPALEESIKAAIELKYESNTPKNEYEMALAEFKLIDPCLEEIARLHTAEIQTFFAKTGVVDIFKEECKGIDLTTLEFSVNVVFNSIPRYFAGDVRPLRDYYRYFLLTENWDVEVVFEINKDSLRTALRAFLKSHRGIKKITGIWVLCKHDDAYAEQYKIDPKFIPDQGNVQVLIFKDGTNEAIDIDESDELAITYDNKVYIRPKSVLQLLRSKKIIVTDGRGRTEALPCLRRVWDIVGDLDMGVVEQALTRRIREMRK
jgi:hypothetical protein